VRCLVVSQISRDNVAHRSPLARISVVVSKSDYFWPIGRHREFEYAAGHQLPDRRPFSSKTPVFFSPPFQVFIFFYSNPGFIL
jgi:hypothetical protein